MRKMGFRELVTRPQPKPTARNSLNAGLDIFVGRFEQVDPYFWGGSTCFFLPSSAPNLLLQSKSINYV